MRKAPLAALALAACLAASFAAAAANAGRGRALYENRCNGCHDESVHGRKARVATSFEAVRTWVRRWSDNLGLAWTDAEVTDVTVHLNERYYRFACPSADCNALTRDDRDRARLALDARER